jgi:hypothetical protein
LLVIGCFGLVLLGRRYRMRASTVTEAKDIPRLTPAEEARLAEVIKGGQG